MTEREAQQEYDDMLNSMFPLEGIYCNHFSILLKEGDSIAYDNGFSDYYDSQEIEIEEN